MRSILLHIYDDDGLDTRVQAAITLARTFAGHVTCLQVGPGHDDPPADPLVAELSADFPARIDRLRLGLRGRVEATLRAVSAPCNWVHYGGATAADFATHSRLVDVIVLSLPGRDGTAQASSFMAAVATNARAPVLAIPRAGPTLDLSGPALVAWDGSPEASVALRASLPLLKQSRSVRLLEIDEGTKWAVVDDASAYLSRHGIDAMVIHRVAGSSGVGMAIEKAATKMGASLIVMGAYGHSRLTEYLIGGATRTMLASSPVALLLAH